MGAVRIAILAVAAIAAIALAFLVRGMLTPKAPPTPMIATAAPAKPMAQVLVAKRDLPIGVRLAPGDMTWQAWPTESLNAAFVTDGAAPSVPAQGADKAVKTAAKVTTDMIMTPGPIQAFEGAIVKEAILKGEPMMARKVVRAGQSGYMAVVVAPGMRAMAVPINAETAAGGFILPGDRVDVLQSRKAAEGDGVVTEVLMRNLRVLAIDQATAPGKDAKTIVGAVATLELPASDVEVLARGKALGEMQLALRSYADAGGVAGRGGPSRTGDGLRVYRGGQVSEVVAQ
ncbi:Flp pilus assembly protein CpaB [Phenylobacterium sp.]|uniref:Flp pilus assembly protein CpaB n=1 Tax=Phenylobacterium sp. TaxID=1871053 RepID=UPI002735E253|nr:Flp pilus assembly protein CpaB [Phenylobacterium sp.]MDP3855660.1 Flp pilus assembly protein CpaB [Phenylobacterium sp.]